MNQIVKILFIGFSISLGAQQSQRTMNLEQCIDYALENNISIKELKLQALIAENEVKRASGNLLPKVSAGASQSANVFHNSTVKVNSFSTQFNFIQADWTIFNGFRNIHQHDKSLLDGEIAKKNWEILENDVVLNIANTYLQVLFNKALVEIAESQLNLSQKQLDIVKIQYEGGVVPLANIADVEAVVAQDELTLVQRKNTVQSSILQLKSLLQLPLDMDLNVEDVDVEKYMNQLAISPTSIVFEKAIAIRPEITLKKIQMESAQKNLEIAEAGVLPTVSLGYGFGTGYTYFNKGKVDGFGDQFLDNLGHSLTLSVNIPIFDGYQNKTNVANAKINQENAALDLANEEYKLRQQIEMSYLDAVNAKKTYEASLKNVEARTTALDFNQKRYKGGFSNVLDFEIAKNNWVAAKGNLVQAKYDFLFKVKVLEFYTNNKFDIRH